jgi:hypothetical protein
MRTKTFAVCFLLALLSCNKEEITTPVIKSSVEEKSSANDLIFIGAHYQGGIIFWIDSTGKHGLIAALKDYKNSIKWASEHESVFNNITDESIGAGEENTKEIIKTLRRGTYAALACHKLEVGVYDDWFLPSKGELHEMFVQRNVIGNLLGFNYWSSTESTGSIIGTYAWAQNMVFDSQVEFLKNSTLAIRAIRRF